MARSDFLETLRRYDPEIERVNQGRLLKSNDRVTPNRSSSGVSHMIATLVENERLDGRMAVTMRQKSTRCVSSEVLIRP